jgi:hypothetical protein
VGFYYIGKYYSGDEGFIMGNNEGKVRAYYNVVWRSCYFIGVASMGVSVGFGMHAV